MRVLGVDFGAKRIGLAVGDTEHRVATPRPNLMASGALATDAKALVETARREEAGAIVIGIPVAETDRMARVCHQLADRVEGEGWKVFRIDESLTSVAAEASMADLKGSYRRKLKDGVAACLILERFFSEAAP